MLLLISSEKQQNSRTMLTCNGDIPVIYMNAGFPGLVGAFFHRIRNQIVFCFRCMRPFSIGYQPRRWRPCLRFTICICRMYRDRRRAVLSCLVGGICSFIFRRAYIRASVLNTHCGSHYRIHEGRIRSPPIARFVCREHSGSVMEINFAALSAYLMS